MLAEGMKDDKHTVAFAEQQLPEMIPQEKVKKTVVTAKKSAAYTETKEEVRKPEPPSYMSWLAEKIFPRKRRESVLVAEEEASYTAKSGSVALEEENERTVLLAALQKPLGPELICEQTGEIIPLRKFPFYIGSAKEFADFVPIVEGVSRIHCCINKRENSYYLSDLNSTNGTYLNGKEVIPGKEVLLSAKDELKICSQDFYIKLPCH